MRLVGLFEALAKTEEGVSLADLSTTIAAPKSSLLGILRSMVADSPLPTAGSVVGKIVTSSLLGAALISMESGARTHWSSWQRRRSRTLRFR